MKLLIFLAIFSFPFLSHGQVVPLVDYHQHLISEPKAKAMYDPPLAAVTLPNDLADLVRARESAWNI